MGHCREIEIVSSRLALRQSELFFCSFGKCGKRMHDGQALGRQREKVLMFATYFSALTSF